MRTLQIYNFGTLAGKLYEIERNHKYKFVYEVDYNEMPVSQTMPLSQKEFEFNEFPPFFDGLLPEGIQLENFLRQTKTDRNDLFTQLAILGNDFVGSVTIEEVNE